MFFKKPYCPWCRGPVQRIDRRHWTCAPCTELYEAARRDQIDPPWIDGVDPADTTLPEAFRENRFHETFTGTIHSWMVQAQRIGNEDPEDARRDREHARRERQIKRIHDQIRVAMDRGLEPLLDRFNASHQAVPLHFHRCAAKDRRINAMESLLRWNNDDETFATLIEDGIDEPTDQRPLVDYLLTWLGHVGIRPADDNVVLNDGGWRNHADDDFASTSVHDHMMGDDEPVWLSYFHDNIPTGTSDEDIDKVARAFLNAGAYLDINSLAEGRNHGYRWSDEWLQHLHTRLCVVGMQVLDDRIAAGYDLHLLYGRSFRSREAVDKLMAAGLSFSGMGPGAFGELIHHHPALALEVLKDGLPMHVVDSDHDGPFLETVKNMLGCLAPTSDDRAWYDLYNEVFLTLLDAGVNVNAVERNGDKRTAAAIALDHGHEGLFRLLHRHGARIEPCIAHMRALLTEPPEFRWFQVDRAKIEHTLAMLIGIQQDELRAVVADSVDKVEPVQRAAGRRRL
jgi:hypothetical protein